MYSNFYFLEDVLPQAYKLACQMEDYIRFNFQLPEQFFGQFLEMLINDLIKRRNIQLPKKTFFNKKLAALSLDESLSIDFQNAYNERSSGVHVDEETNEIAIHVSGYYLHMIKKLNYLAIKYLEIVKEEDVDRFDFIHPCKLERDRKPPAEDESTEDLLKARQNGIISKESIDNRFLSPVDETDMEDSESINQTLENVSLEIPKTDLIQTTETTQITLNDDLESGISSDNDSLLKNCLICGKKTFRSNFCVGCLDKINFVPIFKRIHDSITKLRFTKQDIVGLGYTSSESSEYIEKLKNYNLIKENSGLYVFEKDCLDFLVYGEILDVEKLFVDYYYDELSTSEIVQNEYYKLGQEDNKIFKRFYSIVNEERFDKFLNELNKNEDYKKLESDYLINNDELSSWYNNRRINQFIQSKGDSNFNNAFINVTGILMNKFLALRANGLTRKEILKELNIKKDVLDFWFKKSFKRGLNETYEIFDDFISQNEIIDMDLILKSIDDDKTREEIAIDADVKLSNLNNYYKWGMEGNEYYLSFYNSFKREYVYKRMGAYLENLRFFKPNEALKKTNITKEELNDWNNQGRIDFLTFNPNTEKFMDFFLIRFVLLGNNWLHYRKKFLTREEVSKKIEVSLSEVDEWLSFGSYKFNKNLKGYELFKGFYNDEQSIIIDSIIALIDEGDSLEEARIKLGLNKNDLDRYFELGSKEDSIYRDYYLFIIEEYIPVRKEKFLNLLEEGKSKENAAKMSQLLVEDIDGWYELGKDGDPNFIGFYDKYFNIKLKNYKNYLIKGKTKKDALRLSKLDENEILGKEDEINVAIEKSRMDSVIKEVKNNNSAKAAKKLKIKQNLIFEWFEKGCSGEKEYIDFYTQYKKIYVDIGCKSAISYFKEGFNKKETINKMKKDKKAFDIKDLEHWQKLGLLKDEKYYKDNKDKITEMEDDLESINDKDLIEIEDLDYLKETDKKSNFMFKYHLNILENLFDKFNIKESSSFNSKLNYVEFENKIQYSIKDYNMDYGFSQNLQIAYLNILSNEEFNDYGHVWYWVIKKANDPDFDIDSINVKAESVSVEEGTVSDSKIVSSIVSDDQPVTDEDLITEDNLGADEDLITDDSIDDYEDFEDPISYLEDYNDDDYILTEEEKSNKAHDLIVQNMDEIFRDEDFEGGFITEDLHSDDLEIKDSEDLVSEEAETLITESDEDISDVLTADDSDEDVSDDLLVDDSELFDVKIVSSTDIKTEETIDSKDFNTKIKALFTTKIISKELTNQIKSEYNIPIFVIEYVIDRFTDKDITDFESITKVLKYSFRQTNKPDSFDVVDKLSVKLDYKQNSYIASFRNLGYKLPIDSSFPFQYENLLSGDVWAYVKLNNKDNLSVEDLSLIEGPYFRLNKITDLRKEFTKEEWIDLLLKSCNINPVSMDYDDKLKCIIKMIPFVENNFYLLDINDNRYSKSNIYENVSFRTSTVKNNRFNNIFYTNKQNKRGPLSYLDSLVIDNISEVREVNQKNYIIEYISTETNSESSLVFSNYLRSDVIDFIKGSQRSNKLVNSIICDGEFLENIHCIVTDVGDNEASNECGFSTVVLSEYFNKLRGLDYTELYEKYFKLSEGLKLKDVNAIKKTSSGMIKLLYPDGTYEKEDIAEIIEISIKSRKIIKRILDGDELRLSYIDLDNAKEIFI